MHGATEEMKLHCLKFGSNPGLYEECILLEMKLVVLELFFLSFPWQKWPALGFKKLRTSSKMALIYIYGWKKGEFRDCTNNCPASALKLE